MFLFSYYSALQQRYQLNKLPYHAVLSTVFCLQCQPCDFYLPMQKLLSIVKQKADTQVVDITLKFTLSALWNLTDESPSTCAIFLNEGGLDLFIQILSVCGEKAKGFEIVVSFEFNDYLKKKPTTTLEAIKCYIFFPLQNIVQRCVNPFNTCYRI